MGSCFEFLRDKFPDIYLDCERMEKNIINGGGIESIMLCGRVNEKITKKIYELENISDCPESQFKRVQKLAAANIIPNSIKNNFKEIRRLRNDVYHDDVSGELNSAREAHKLCFKILIWFYENYSSDKNFIMPKYKISKTSKEYNFLKKLRNLVNSSDFKELKKSSKNNSIVNLLSGLEEDVPIANTNINIDEVYKLNNSEIKIRKPDCGYSKALGISYDDNYFMWVADFDGKQLGFFDSPKEAYEYREIYLRSIPIPSKNKKRGYSDYDGISFSKIHRLWTANVNGQIIGYYGSEKKALMAKKDYILSNNSKSTNVHKSKKTSIKSKSTKNLSSNKLAYGNKFKKSKNNVIESKSKSKLQSKNKNKIVKVINGSKVKSKQNKIKSKKLASKYNGVYYEEGLFMWGAEVNGKQLGLFSSENEAYKTRQKYLKKSSNNL